jgi:hypothetical protein
VAGEDWRGATVPETLWLSCHVDYACRHSGVCCRAGWPLPVEARVVPAIDAAVAGGRVRTVNGSVLWLHPMAEAPEGMAGTLEQVGGGCVFHLPRVEAPAGQRSAGRTCAVHAALGPEALPSTCQHFPRVCLIDDRGVRVSLSHACPTAAAMLVDHAGPVTIVSGPPAVPGRDVPEGLDARDGLPPRLNDRVLMDLDGLSAWEAYVVDRLAGLRASPGPVGRTLAALAGDAAQLSDWAPGRGPLVEAVHALGAGSDDDWLALADDRPAAVSGPVALARAAAACRPPWTWAPPPADLDEVDARHVTPTWARFDGVVRRYLAAKAFGSWLAWQADGARGLVAWLQMAHAVLRVECARACAEAGRRLDRELLLTAVRQADLLLLHYADCARLAAALGAQ